MVESVQKPRRRRQLVAATGAPQDDLVKAVASIHALVKSLEEKFDSKTSRDEHQSASIRQAIVQLESAIARPSLVQGVEWLDA